MNKFLEKIVDYKISLNKEKKGIYYGMHERIKDAGTPNRFKHALLQKDRLALIAEVKKASPSKGIIRDDFDPVEIANIYHKHNADAISVLTEDKYFLGSPEYIKDITESIDTPVLTKDFIIDEGQMYEARGNGASAVLLIKAILDDKTLKKFITAAAVVGLDCLVEIHDEDELKAALDCGAEIIGVNNRDLQDFTVRSQTSERIIPKIPDNIVKVAESGYKSFDQIQELKTMGANAVLIGETFMSAENIGSKIEEVMYGQS